MQSMIKLPNDFGKIQERESWVVWDQGTAGGMEQKIHLMHQAAWTFVI
jgi:hypothetical protein